MPKIGTAAILLLGCAPVSIPGNAQSADPHPVQSKAESAQHSPTSPRPPAERIEQTETSADPPLPDIVTTMRDVETNQRKAEALEKNYMYHSVETAQQIDGRGQIKKTTVTEFDHYWLDGVPVRRVVKRDGKALTTQEVAKEDERIDKTVAKTHAKREKADAESKETDPRGNEEITVSRLIELGAFSNARRVQLHGRDTIAVDYIGDPKAKTRNRAEDAVRDLRGTAWIDERDRRLVRAEGRFVNSFKVGGGLVVNIAKDTRFTMEQTKVNDEVWLPANIDAWGAARVLLFFNFNGSIHAVHSDYRKFRATSTILPGATRVDTPKTGDDFEDP